MSVSELERVADILLRPPAVSPEEIAGTVMRSRTRHVAADRLRVWIEARGGANDMEMFGRRCEIDADIAAELAAVAEGRSEDASPEVRVAYGIGMDSARRAREYAALEAATRAAVEGTGRRALG